MPVARILCVNHRTVSVPLKHWHRVLACVEAAMQDAAQNSEVLSFGSGAIVQDATHRAVSQYTGPTTSFGWPPDEHHLAITLEDGEWAWVFQHLDLWGYPDEFEQVAAKQFLTDALGDPPPAAR